MSLLEIQRDFLGYLFDRFTALMDEKRGNKSAAA